MPRQPRQLSESGVYHVMLRGINRQAIFLDDVDRERFLSCLTATKPLSGCRVLAYCLMANHVHLILQTTAEPIGQVVKRLGVRYAGWFNRRHDRVGHVFQDRFKSRPVEDDAYLTTLLRYVWNNPVEAGLTPRPEDYPWSSLRLLGHPDRLVDEQALRALVPATVLTEIAAKRAPAPIDERPITGGPPRQTDAAAAALLRQICGANTVAQFNTLDLTVRHRAIRELRARGVSSLQVASLTGLNERTIRRMRSETDAGAAPPGAA